MGTDLKPLAEATTVKGGDTPSSANSAGTTYGNSHVLSVSVGPDNDESTSNLICINDESRPSFIDSDLFVGYICIRMNGYKGLPAAPTDPIAADYLDTYAVKGDGCSSTEAGSEENNNDSKDTHGACDNQGSKSSKKTGKSATATSVRSRFFNKYHRYVMGSKSHASNDKTETDSQKLIKDVHVNPEENVNVKNLNDIRPIIEKPESSYFKGRNRRYSIMLQGRFKKELPADDIYFGFDFDTKVRTPIGTSLAIKMARWLDPSLEADLNNETNPGVFSPVVSAMNAMAVYPLYSNVLKLGDPYANEEDIYCISHGGKNLCLTDKCVNKSAQKSLENEVKCKSKDDDHKECVEGEECKENTDCPCGAKPSIDTCNKEKNIFGHHKLFNRLRLNQQYSSNHDGPTSTVSAIDIDQTSKQKTSSGFSFGGFFGGNSNSNNTNNNVSDSSENLASTESLNKKKSKDVAGLLSFGKITSSSTSGTKNQMVTATSNPAKSETDTDSIAKDSNIDGDDADSKLKLSIASRLVNIDENELPYLIGPEKPDECSAGMYDKKAVDKNHPLDDWYVGRWAFGSTMVPENLGLLFSPHIKPANEFERIQIESNLKEIDCKHNEKDIEATIDGKKKKPSSKSKPSSDETEEKVSTNLSVSPKVVDFTCKCEECERCMADIGGLNYDKLKSKEENETVLHDTILKSLPLSYDKRKKLFSDKKKRDSVTLRSDRVYCMDFYDAYFDMQDLTLKLPGASVDVKKYWDGQPLRFVCKNKTTKEILFSIWFRFVDNNKIDDYLNNKFQHQVHHQSKREASRH